jgi:hypothetical protein
MIEYLGAESFAYARASDNNTIVFATKGRSDLTPANPCTARFDPSQALLFDDKGKRIA